MEEHKIPETGGYIGLAALVTAITGGAAAILKVYTSYQARRSKVTKSVCRNLHNVDHHRPGRVMIVDDLPAIVASTVMVLEEEGYAVRGFTSAREALVELSREAAGDGPYDVMLLDLNMPEMGGQEVAYRALLIDRCLSIVVITGHSKSTAIMQLTQLGAASWLTKPFDAEQLQRAVRSACTLSRERRRK